MRRRRAGPSRPTASASTSRSPATTPSVASLWPQIPLVAECSTRSTPWCSGCWPSGVANVESTRVNGPRSPRARRGRRCRGVGWRATRRSPASSGRARRLRRMLREPCRRPTTRRCPCARTGLAGRRSCRHRSGAGRRRGHRSSTARRQPTRWPPFRTRRPGRPRRPRARRSLPRRRARSGWRTA